MCELKCTQTLFGPSKYFFCVANRKMGIVATNFAFCILLFIGLIISIVEMNEYFNDKIGYNELVKRTMPVSSSKYDFIFFINVTTVSLFDANISGILV